MSMTVILGAQWGDEGKGKVTSYLSRSAYICARFQGGPNADHTVYINGKKMVFRMVPAGIIHSQLGVIGNGAVINLDMLLEEINQIARYIPTVVDHLRISYNAHVILSSHIDRDTGQVSRSIGTTGMGVGPTYVDKVTRVGIRISDLFSTTCVNRLNQIDKQSAERFTERLGQCCVDTVELVRNALDGGRHIVAEGAQGALLDIDHGDYPYVTSSNTTIGAVLTGLGVSAKDISTIFLVVCAYMSKVAGTGPFQKRLGDPTAKYLQGREDGIDGATNKLRDYSWLDLSLIKQAARVNLADGIILTKLDVLSGLPEVRLITNSDSSEASKELRLQGWEADLANIQTFDDLPSEAKAYVSCIEEEVEVPVIGISVGPHEHQYIECKSKIGELGR